MSFSLATDLHPDDLIVLPHRLPPYLSSRTPPVPAGTEVRVFDTYTTGSGSTHVRVFCPASGHIRSFPVNPGVHFQVV